MTAILRHYVKLVLLRAAPQDMPASASLLKILVLLYLILAIVNTSSVNGISYSLIASVIDLAMLFIFTHLILRNKKYRFNQTFSSFMGVGLVIGVVHALSLAMFSIDQDPQNMSEFVRLIFFVIFIWVVVVYSHIIRHAADTSMAVASCISLAYIVLNVMMLVSVSELLKA